MRFGREDRFAGTDDGFISDDHMVSKIISNFFKKLTSKFDLIQNFAGAIVNFLS